jgi:hypothetical protein
MQRIDHRTVHIVVHAVHDLEGLSIIRALQQTTLLYPDKERMGILGMKRDVLGVGKVGRGRKAPVRHIPRAQSREFGPVMPEIIARKQVGRLRAGIQPHTGGQAGAR